MKKLLILFLTCCILQVHGQTTADWYNFPGGVSIATDISNNVYTADWDYNAAGDITLTKRSAAGIVLWNAKYDNTDITRHEMATWLAVDNSGNIVVSGTIRSGFSNPVNAASVLMKFNAAGALLWRIVYENSFDGSSTRKCIVDASDNIYVLGIGTGSNGQVTKVKKFSSSGAVVWDYFDAGIGAPITFKLTPDNKIIIVHRSLTGILTSYSKIDLNGNNIWSVAGIQSSVVGDAAGDAAGNSYMINSVTGGSTITKLSPAGAVVWTQSNTINGSKVEVGTDNNPVVGGTPLSGFGAAFVKYDNNGNLLWQNLDADGPSLAFLAITPMRLDASNAAYIGGSTMSAMGICKVNSNGTSAWAATTPSGYPVWFSFGSDGNVYVTGGTTARFLQAAVAACGVPAGLSTTNITLTGATLNWSSVAGAAGYNIRYRRVGAPNWIMQLVNAPATSVAIPALVSFSTYEWQIQALCQTASDFSPSVNFVTSCSAPPAVINGSVNLCAGIANLLSANRGTGLTYQWLLNNSNIAGATGPTFSATVAGSYSCMVSNACGFGVSNTLVLTAVSVPLVPGIIGGQRTGLCGGVTKSYSISPVNAATSYSWTVPAGAAISSGQGTTGITVVYAANFSSGTINVTASNSCGTSPASAATVSGAPATPGSITGSSTACSNQTLIYSIAAVTGAASYTWTVPTGATIVSGQGTNTVRIRFRRTAGSVRVRSNNSCGSSAYRSLSVTISCRTLAGKPANFEDALNAEISIYPNPSATAFRLNVTDYDQPAFSVVVTDISGRIVETHSKINAGREFVFGDRLSPGVYFVNVWTGQKPVTLKIIKH
jgi:PKD-like domain/Secretion system C-terminal sorting domain/Fibronectin type III domain